MFLFSKNKISDKKDSSSKMKKDVIIYDYINRLEDKVKECHYRRCREEYNEAGIHSSGKETDPLLAGQLAHEDRKEEERD